MERPVNKQTGWVSDVYAPEGADRQMFNRPVSRPVSANGSQPELKRKAPRPRHESSGQ